MTAEPRPHTPDVTPPPVPLSRTDTCSATVAALVAAAAQLREYGVVRHCGGGLPRELARPGDGVTTGSLYAVAEWLEARAGLYGWQPQPVATVDVIGGVL